MTAYHLTVIAKTDDTYLWSDSELCVVSINPFHNTLVQTKSEVYNTPNLMDDEVKGVKATSGSETPKRFISIYNPKKNAFYMLR